MNNGWSEVGDSLDTLCVPFVWVPDGAPEPTEWLAEHPDAFWVPATLVRGESSDRELEVEPDSVDGAYVGGPNGHPPDEDGSMPTQAPSWPVGDKVATGSAGFASSHYGREDPIAAYLRINAMFGRLGVGPSAGTGNVSTAVAETGGSSPVLSRAADAHASAGNDPLNVTDTSRPSGQATDVARWGLLGAAIGGVCAVAEPCGVGVAAGTAIGAAAVTAGAIILNNKIQEGQTAASPPSGIPDASSIAPRPDVPARAGGRGGQNVKGLSGPPNSAIPSASGDRIYITDDQGRVILDVDRHRAKVVLPGHGFQKGGKVVPTPPAYLDLMNKVFPR